MFSPDTVRRDHLSCYGYRRKTTPNLDRLAEDGVLFADHIANCGWTLPQYMTMHTGMYPLTHGMTLLKSNPPLSSNITTLAEVLKEQGYVSQGFSSSNSYLHPQLGYSRGFDDYMWGLGYNQSTRRETQEVLRWLDENAKRNKFFIFVHDNDTHEPFNAPEPFNNQWGEEYIDKYDGELTHVDYYFGKILDKIEDLGLKDNTLVAYVSDHGTEFQEHGFLEKKVNLYNEILHVPLVMSCPAALPKGKMIKGLVATVDLVPTILDILGLPPKKDAQGRSFLPLIRGEPGATPRKQVFSHTEHNTRFDEAKKASFEHVSVYTDIYKFIRAKILLPFEEEFFKINWVSRFRTLAERTGMNPEDIRQGTVFRELYDLRTDPNEQKNVFSEHRKVAQHLERQVDQWLQETLRRRMELAPSKIEMVLVELPRWPEMLGEPIIPQCLVPILVNAGGQGYVDKGGRTWLADRPYSFGRWGYITFTYTDVLYTSEKIAGTLDSALHQSQRFGQSFTYRFDVPNGKYQITLHFAETLMVMGGMEFFDVRIQGKPVLTSYNIFNEAGGRNKAVKRTFTCNVTRKQLSIDFKGLTEPQQEAAKISAIEIQRYTD